MSENSYDEDLEKNEFFEQLRSKSSDLFREALEHKYYILVPKRGSLKGLLNLPDNSGIFKRHIVRFEDTDNGDVVHRNMHDEIIETSSDGQVLTLYSLDNQGTRHHAISVRILFEETYLTEAGASCKLLCISRPLTSFPNEHAEPYSKLTLDLLPSTSTGPLSPFSTWPRLDTAISPSSPFANPFSYYRSVLFNDDSDGRLEAQLKRNLSRFSERVQSEYRPSWHFEQLKILVREEFYATFKDILTRRRRLAEKLDSVGMSRLQISTEIFFFQCIHVRLLGLLCACVRDEESTLNKMKYATSELAPSDWGIGQDMYGDLPVARKQLSILNDIDNPYGKLLCLRKTIASLVGNPGRSNGKRAPITTDDLLPSLAFLIAKSNISNWTTNILYMREFHFCSYANDELRYCLASFEAAVQFVKDGTMKEVVVSRCRDWALGKPLENNQEVKEVANIIDKEVDDPNLADTDYWECLIAALHSNDEGAVRDCLNAGQEPTHAEVDNSLGDCHPLCECPRCVDQRQKLRYSIRCVTAQGFTALHFAALLGQTSMLHYLIRSGGDTMLEKGDEHGRTPLHWACRIGSQSCTLLLLHHGANSNPVDQFGNTPLHLATYYGFVDCVKALLYFNQQVRGSTSRVNLSNQFGETPLHIAVRLHHVDIVSVLLECGANTKLRDQKGNTAFDLCEDYETRRLLTSVSPFIELVAVDVSSNPSQITMMGSNGNQGDIVAIRAAVDRLDSLASTGSAFVDLNIEQIDKLLKAVTDDDLPLVKYYLGRSNERSGPGVVADKCHPLCQCPKCEDVDEEISGAVNVNATGSSGLNALHTAVLYGRIDIVDYLLEYCGADVNWPSAADGRTALHMAVLAEYVPVIGLLVKHKAEIVIKDYSGDTPLHLAAVAGNAVVLHHLFDQYENECLRIVNSTHDALLIRAAKDHQRDVSNKFLENGADIIAKN